MAVATKTETTFDLLIAGEWHRLSPAVLLDAPAPVPRDFVRWLEQFSDHDMVPVLDEIGDEQYYQRIAIEGVAPRGAHTQDV